MSLEKNGIWIDISDNEEATNKLNEKYPEALTTDTVNNRVQDESQQPEGDADKEKEKENTRLFTGEKDSNLRKLINAKFGRDVNFSDDDFQGFLDKHPNIKGFLEDENTSDEEKFNFLIDSDFMDLPMFDELNKKLNKYIAGQTQF